MIDWIKNENGSMDIIYFQEDLVIETEQFFDTENFHIRLKIVSVTYNRLSSNLVLVF